MGRIGKSVDGIYHDRIIDIDLLICLDISGREVLMDTPQLKLPHPLIHLRDFVMKPLKEIAPELTYSILSKQKENEKNNISIVFLKTFLTRDSVLENIRMGSNATLEEVRAAAKEAQIDDFIMSLRMDTIRKWAASVLAFPAEKSSGLPLPAQF